MLLMRFTKFEVSQDTAPSQCIRFKYFGACYIEIEEARSTAAAYVKITSWQVIDGMRKTHFLGVYTARKEAHERLVHTFAGIDAVCEVRK